MTAINVDKHIQEQLGIFMLTHDCANESTIDIYNMFVKAANIIITPTELPDLLAYIDFTKTLDLDDCIISAECDKTIARLVPKLYVRMETCE